MFDRWPPTLRWRSLTLQALCAGTLWAVAALRPPAASGAEPSFAFEFATAIPTAFSGTSGSVITPFEVFCMVRPAGLTGVDGPRAWILGATHSPELELLQVSTAGTDAASRLDPITGYAHVEILDPAKNGGKGGFISYCTLAEDLSVSLVPDDWSSLVVADYRSRHPIVYEPTTTKLRVEYLDTVPVGESLLATTVRYREQSYTPELHALEIPVETTPTCQVGLRLEAHASGSVLKEDSRRVLRQVRAGLELHLDVSVKLTINLATGSGPEAWSLSVRHDALLLDLVSVAADLRAIDEYLDEDDHFIKSQIVRGDEGGGFIQAVILSLASQNALPATGELNITDARYRLVAPHDEPGLLPTTRIRFEDGLRVGENPPVTNVFARDGETEVACFQTPLDVTVEVLRGGKVFLRGDANNDARVNISDVIRTAGTLFFGDEPFVCEAASDTNRDFRADTSDLVYLLQHLFQRGQALPEPFPVCGPDLAVRNVLPCKEDAVRCP